MLAIPLRCSATKHTFTFPRMQRPPLPNAFAIFERIAKEGRRYGVGLDVISQRPAKVNRTVVSQCNCHATDQW